MDYTTRMLSNPPENVHSPVLIDADQPQRTISWQQYASAVKRIAIGLGTMGLNAAGGTEQEGVALLSRNDIYYYVLGDGAVAAGGAFAGIPSFVKQTELVTAITAAQVKWLFVAPEFLDLALATVQIQGPGKPDSTTVIVFDPPGLEPYRGSHPSLRKIMNVADESLFLNPNEGKDPIFRTAFRLFTSGTTGSVKAAEISHATQLARIDHNFCPSPHVGRALQIIGMYHISGLMPSCRACLGKSTLYVSTTEDAATVLDRIQSLGITSAMLPPRIMAAIADIINRGWRPLETLQSLRFVTFGGALCRKEIIEAFTRFLPSHASLICSYGSTESGPISAAACNTQWTIGNVGFPAPGVEVKIVNPETFELASPDTEGEICVRSGFVFTRYYGNPGAMKSAFLPGEQGWLRTGDKGFLDAGSGELKITGRFKGIFKVKYEEVAPTEVEHELLKHPKIADALVMATEARDNSKDLECMAYVVQKQDSQMTAQDVVNFIASRMAPHKAPTGGVVFCESFPRGAMGKVIKGQLKDIEGLAGSAKFLDIPA